MRRRVAQHAGSGGPPKPIVLLGVLLVFPLPSALLATVQALTVFGRGSRGAGSLRGGGADTTWAAAGSIAANPVPGKKTVCDGVGEPAPVIVGQVHMLCKAPSGVSFPVPKVPQALPTPKTPWASPTPRPVGVFVMLHACSHNSHDFFKLPEHLTMTTHLLQRRMLLLVPDAQWAVDSCWHPQVDAGLVTVAVGSFLAASGLSDLPLYGLGISSGGVALEALVATKIGAMAPTLPFRGLHFNVSPGGAYVQGPANAKVGNPGTFATVRPHPPSSFVFMAADEFGGGLTATKAAQAALVASGTPVQLLEARPEPIWRLKDRAGKIGVSPVVIEQALQRLREWHYLESRDCQHFGYTSCLFLRMKKGDAVVGHLIARPEFIKTLYPKSRELYEEVHALEGFHGPTATHFQQSMAWLFKVAPLPPQPGAGASAAFMAASTRNDDVRIGSKGNETRSSAAPPPNLASSRRGRL